MFWLRCACQELHMLLEVTRMTHSLLTEHMALDPFENLLKEVRTAVQRTCATRLQRVADMYSQAAQR